MPDYDPYSIQLADEPTALEMARARAAALRGQNYAGLVGSLAHDPYAARSGAALMQGAQQGLQELGQAPGERMRQLLGRQQLQNEQRQAAPYTDPAQAAILAKGQQGAAKMMGVNIPEGATPTTGQLFLSAFEKPYEAEQNRLLRQQLATMPQYGVNPATGQLYNKRGGAGGAAPDAAAAATPGAAPAAQPLVGKFLDKALKDLGADFDPSGGRSGEFGKNQARVNAANRLLALATDEHGMPKDLNPQQMPELSQALASLISGGGAGAQAQIEHLTPKTLRGDFQRTMQWVTGNPRGADQVAFVQNMIETAKREKDTASQSIESVRGQRAAKHQRVLLGNPQESARVLQGFGWDLGPDGMPVPKAAAAAPSAKRKVYNPATGQIEEQ